MKISKDFDGKFFLSFSQKEFANLNIEQLEMVDYIIIGEPGQNGLQFDRHRMKKKFSLFAIFNDPWYKFT